MVGDALADIEISVNVGYAHDIRGEISGETGVVALADGNPILIRSKGALSGPIPTQWEGRFESAYEAEFHEWVTAANGTAIGPSAWDSVCSDPHR
jgi:myo-inositol 2-dehydrogenase/D-chiro-inositol 1-dehydrogenase